MLGRHQCTFICCLTQVQFCQTTGTHCVQSIQARSNQNDFFELKDAKLQTSTACPVRVVCHAEADSESTSIFAKMVMTRHSHVQNLVGARRL